MKIGLKKMNGKKIREDLIAIFLFVISFCAIYLIITKGKYLYGSSMDWESQHYLIPEYFRNLFYSTKNLFPSFALNLGAGQNIYYMSYYGLYSPLFLVSYLLPFIKMIDYVQFLGFLIPISSTILFYFYLRRHFSYSISLLVSFMFLFSGPILFHSHRHLMFISYMPFYVLALYGLDSYVNKGKMFLLSLSCLLIVLTSYYYSVGSFISLYLYGTYLLYKNKKFNIKELFKFMLPFIIAVMSSMILILPTFYTLTAGRDVTNVGPSFISLITPKMGLKFLLYSSYSIGLTVISFIALLHLLFKKREDIIFGIILLLIVIFPIFNYIFNGTLYIDSKALIPFLPIILIFVSEFLDDILSNKVSKYEFVLLFIVTFLFTNFKVVYLDLFLTFVLFLIYFKTKKFNVFCTIFIIFLFFTSIGVNLSDKLSLKSKVYSEDYKSVNDAVKFILGREENLYRISDNVSSSFTMNRVTSMDELKTTIYSSTFNKKYNNYFFEVMNNAIPYRNKSMTPTSVNPLFRMMMGEKYIITLNDEVGLEKIYEKNNVKVYLNSNVLPIGYSTDRIITTSSNYPKNVLDSIGSISSTINSDNLEKENIDYDILYSQNILVDKKDDEVILNAYKNAYMEISLNKDYSGKLLFLRMKNNYNPTCNIPEIWININGIKNKLSCSSWKYHNQNYVFDYVFKDTNILKIKFGKGEYHLSDFELYSYDYSDLVSKVSSVDEFIFDRNKTNGDKIVGSINSKSDGYFVMSIPYDKGFTAYVDGVKTDVLEVNSIFIGFPISKGNHNIVIKYEAPFKTEGMIISLIGILLLIGLLVYDKRRFKWIK